MLDEIKNNNNPSLFEKLFVWGDEILPFVKRNISDYYFLSVIYKILLRCHGRENLFREFLCAAYQQDFPSALVQLKPHIDNVRFYYPLICFAFTTLTEAELPQLALSEQQYLLSYFQQLDADRKEYGA